jgi:formylglycine-generating enzyme required for sulfatase activity
MTLDFGQYWYIRQDAYSIARNVGSYRYRMPWVKRVFTLFLLGWLWLCAAAQLPDFTTIPAGNFVMGADSLGNTQHSVTLSQDYQLSTSEITVSQYASMLNYALSQDAISISACSVTNATGTAQELVDFDSAHCPLSFDGSIFAPNSGMDDYPMVEITWFGAAFYCNLVSQQYNLTPLYNLTTWQRSPVAAAGLRLPTEAEWEYAARYNDARTFPWGEAPVDSTRANCFGIGPGGATPVGEYAPAGDSQLGLHDMAGNVWEWCEDWFGPYPATAQTDPTGPITGERKIIRGGGWMSPSYQLLCAHRSRNWQDHSYYDFGFRVAQQAASSSAQQPSQPHLRCQVYPNPTSSGSSISFALPASAFSARVTIYTIRGQKVAELISEHAPSTGTLQWNGRYASGHTVAAGLYLYRITARGSAPLTGKLLLIR